MDNVDAPLDPFADTLTPLIAPSTSDSGGGTPDTGGPSTQPTPTNSLDLSLGFAGQLFQVLANIPQELLALDTEIENAHPLRALKSLSSHIERGLASLDVASWLPTLAQGGGGTDVSRTDIEAKAFNVWRWMSTISGGALYTAFLKFGLDIDTTVFSDDAKLGVETTDMLLGFAMALPYALSFIDFAGKGIFANRWPESVTETLKKMPEEIGLTWAMGMNIEESYAVAVGKTIEEEINLQKRPNRIEWPVLRTILRQKPGDRDKIELQLKRNGFPDDQIAWIMELTDANIPVGDLQQLYEYDLAQPAEILPYIKQLGFNDHDANLLWQLYIKKANTPSSTIYRSTARQMFRDYLMSEDDYVQILDDTNTPKREIANDLKAIELEHKIGRTQEGSAVIKARRLHNIIDDGEAVTRLQQLGMTHEAAIDMVASWLLPPIHPKHGLSQARILSYLISGVLTPDQARPLLIDTGLNSNAVDMLLAHPNAHPQVTVHKLSPSFVITAYLDGAIDETGLVTAFTKAGVASEDMEKWVTVAHYRYSHRKQTSGGTIPLTKGEIVEAYKYGIYDEHQASLALQALNYDITNATILLEIANKGIFQPAQQPAFSNVEGALTYLESLGFTIYGPPDPRIAAAESMLSNAGYSYQPPADFPLGPPVSGPLGGGKVPSPTGGGPLQPPLSGGNVPPPVQPTQ